MFLFTTSGIKFGTILLKILNQSCWLCQWREGGNSSDTWWYLELLYLSLIACWGLVAASLHVECNDTKHSFNVSHVYPVKAIISSGHVTSTLHSLPIACLERAKLAAAIMLGGYWRNLSPCSKDSSDRNCKQRTNIRRCKLFKN